MNAGSGSGWSGREASQGEYILSLGELLQVMRRRLWVIVFSALVLVVLVVGYSVFVQTPQYAASAKILIGQKQLSDSSGLGGQVQGLQDVTPTMAEAVNTRSVAEAAIKQGNLSMSSGEILSNLNAEQVPDTQFIQVSYTDTSPRSAEQVTNAVGKAFSQRVSELSPGASSITATVWDQAAVSQNPVSPNPVRNGVLALLVGVILGICLAFIIDQLDDSWRSPEEVEQISGLPNFGAIPEFKPAKSAKKGSYR